MSILQGCGFNEAISQEEAESIIHNNKFDEFEKLRGIMGICLDPQTWEHAAGLIAVPTVENIGQLGRHPRDIVIYHQFRKETLQTYVSIAEYLKVIVFQYSTKTAEDGRLKAGERPTSERVIVWRPNDFPYHFEEGIEHHNIWCTEPMSEEEIWEVIRENRKGHEVLMFVNPPQLMTVPELWHCHVLSRPKPQ